MSDKLAYGVLLCLVTACGGDAGRKAAGAGAAAVSAVASSDNDSTRSDSRPVVLFMGTSLTAGLGLTIDEAYPALIQAKIDSAKLDYRAVNAGVSGETTAGALRRIDWLLNQPVAVLVLESGANDALRGQDLKAAEHNLQAIIDRTRSRYPDVQVVVAGMQAPPNLGTQYTAEFRELFVRMALHNHAALIPFLLDGVGGMPDLNQADGIHPTAKGQRIVADNVWRTLGPLLRTAPAR